MEHQGHTSPPAKDNSNPVGIGANVSATTNSSTPRTNGTKYKHQSHKHKALPLPNAPRQSIPNARKHMPLPNLRLRNDKFVISEHHYKINETNSQIQSIETKLLNEPENPTLHESLTVWEDKLLQLRTQLDIYKIIKNRILTQMSDLSNKEKSELFDRELYRFQHKLPSYAKRLDIENWLNEGRSRFLIVQGTTGSGKSTQIPQYLADHPKIYGKRILCTQPRKIAAISLAERVAYEWMGGNDNYWASPGIQIGFNVAGYKLIHPTKTRIEFLTEGKMLEKIISQKNEFSDIGCIIIDEAHERSQICDLLLGCFKSPDPRWKGIPFIITSATIDINEFSEFFNNAPTIEIQGRTFPVTINYLPQVGWGNETMTSGNKYIEEIVRIARNIHTNEGEVPGDILCFLPGQSDVISAKEKFERSMSVKDEPNGNSLLKTKVFVLYGRMDPKEQSEVFQSLSQDTRKIIFATDMAETSITIEGIVHVVDSGIKKGISYDPKRNITSLQLQSISKSSAIQRAGRAGRTQPGQAYRLYSPEDYEQMELNATPEILLRPLALAVLTLRNLNKDPRKFEWISKPSVEAMIGAEEELILLGALALDNENQELRLTELGNLITVVQQDPKLVKMIYYGCTKGFGESSLILASLLSVSNIFFWTGSSGSKDRELAIAKQKEFMLEDGDIVSLYRTYEQWSKIASTRSKNRNAEGTWCRVNYVNGKAMKIIQATCGELRLYFKKTKSWIKNPHGQNNSPNNDDLSRIAFAGLFLNTSRVFQSHGYGGRRNLQYYSLKTGVIGNIKHGSALEAKSGSNPPPEWIIYDRLIQVPVPLLTCSNRVKEEWIKAENPKFYQECLDKSSELPVALSYLIPPEIISSMIGKFYSNIRNLEAEFQSTIEANLDSNSITIYCKRKAKRETEILLQRKIQSIAHQLSVRCVEQNYLGSTRVKVGQGFEVHDILWSEDFLTVFIRNLPPTITENEMRLNVERVVGCNWNVIQQIQLFKHQETSKTATVSLSSKEHAQNFYSKINGSYNFVQSQTQPITAFPNKPRSGGVSKEIVGRLKVSWASGPSLGKAKIWFAGPVEANLFIENVNMYFPGAIIRVVHADCQNPITSKQIQRRQMKTSDQIKKTPPAFKIHNGHVRGSTPASFRFDNAAIDLTPDEIKANYEYAVSISNLDSAADEFYIKDCLRHSKVLNVRLDRQEDSNPAFQSKFNELILESFSPFLENRSSKTEFVDKGSCRRGLIFGFNRIGILRDVYKSIIISDAWMDLSRPFGQLVRLETEYCLIVSIQSDIYKVLSRDIEGVLSYAKSSLKIHVHQANNTNNKNQQTQQNQQSKFTFTRFYSDDTRYFPQIQQKIDGILSYSKYRSADLSILFGTTGKELMGKLEFKTLFTSQYSQEIWIYGTETLRQKIVEKLDSIIEELKGLEYLDFEFKLNKKVIFGGGDGPGSNRNNQNAHKINEICRKGKLKFYKLFGTRLIISADKVNGDKLKAKLEKERYIFANNYKRSSSSSLTNAQLKECGLCYCVPDSKFILLTNCKSSCGKTFCVDCLVPMFQQQPPPYPLQCPSCENPLAINDILRWGPVECLRKILEVSLEHYQKGNVHTIINCPKPGCGQLLNLATVKKDEHSDSGEFIYCDECISTYCLVCSAKMDKPIQIHEGELCEDVQSGNPNRVRTFIKEIHEKILNLKCPRCDGVFLDFDGCVALTCNKCKAGFCGLCLEDCGVDAHPHTVRCKLNPTNTYYVSAHVLDEAHKTIRIEKLRRYFKELENPEDKEKILQVLCKDLVSLSISLNEL